jgi:putative transposase
MKELKGIYGADNAEEARNRLEDFAESDLGKQYSVIKQMWLSQWDQVVPLFRECLKFCVCPKFII